MHHHPPVHISPPPSQLSSQDRVLAIQAPVLQQAQGIDKVLVQFSDHTISINLTTGEVLNIPATPDALLINTPPLTSSPATPSKP